jgi:hypothetical protein
MRTGGRVDPRRLGDFAARRTRLAFLEALQEVVPACFRDLEARLQTIPQALRPMRGAPLSLEDWRLYHAGRRTTGAAFVKAVGDVYDAWCKARNLAPIDGYGSWLYPFILHQARTFLLVGGREKRQHLT